MVNGELVRRYGSTKAHRVARRVTLAEGEALAKKLGAAFVESSARDNKNVGESASSASRAAFVAYPFLRQGVRDPPPRNAKGIQPGPREEEGELVGLGPITSTPSLYRHRPLRPSFRPGRSRQM